MNSTKNYILNISILLILSFLFILFSCEVSSPLTDRNTNDSAIFMSMGKMFLEGKVPYTEFFDHKGPSIILVEAIAQFFVEGRGGIFILEVFNLFIALFIIYKIGNILKLRNAEKYTVIILLLIYIFRLISKGNTVEELSFVPLFVTLYMLSKYYLQTKAVTPLSAFWIGISFAFLFWLRANNGGFIVGACIFMFISTIIDKDYKSLKNLILYFSVGFLTLSLVYLSYFLYNDALYELIYATFLYNMNYIHTFVSPSSHSLWANIMALVLVTIAAVLYYRKEKDYKIFIFAFCLYFFSALTINMGYSFTYYYLLYAPLLAISGLIIMYSLKFNRLLLVVLPLSILYLSAKLGHKGYYLIKEGPMYKQEAKEYKKSVHTLLSNIPKEDMDKVFYYDIFPTIFLLDGVTSNYKYCFIQEWHGRHDQAIYDEINTTMIENSPSYIVLNNTGEKIDETKFYNKEFINIVKTKYHFFTSDKARVIYKLKE